MKLSLSMSAHTARSLPFTRNLCVSTLTTAEAPSHKASERHCITKWRCQRITRVLSHPWWLSYTTARQLSWRSQKMTTTFAASRRGSCTFLPKSYALNQLMDMTLVNIDSFCVEKEQRDKLVLVPQPSVIQEIYENTM